MAIIVRRRILSMRAILSFFGFLFFLAGLALFALDIARLQGWSLHADRWVPLLLGWSIPEFWLYAKEFAAPGGAALLFAGLISVALSRAGRSDSEPDEEIDVKAVGERIRAFEQVQLQQRDDHGARHPL